MTELCRGLSNQEARFEKYASDIRTAQCELRGMCRAQALAIDPENWKRRPGVLGPARELCFSQRVPLLGILQPAFQRLEFTRDFVYEIVDGVLRRRRGRRDQVGCMLESLRPIY